MMITCYSALHWVVGWIIQPHYLMHRIQFYKWTFGVFAWHACIAHSLKWEEHFTQGLAGVCMHWKVHNLQWQQRGTSLRPTDAVTEKCHRGAGLHKKEEGVMDKREKCICTCRWYVVCEAKTCPFSTLEEQIETHLHVQIASVCCLWCKAHVE